MEHRKAFITKTKAGCACGTVLDATNRKDAAQRLAEHMRHPSAAQRIADAPAEHANCKIEIWSERWGVCEQHLVYVDLNAGTKPQGEQMELSFT